MFKWTLFHSRYLLSVKHNMALIFKKSVEDIPLCVSPQLNLKISFTFLAPSHQSSVQSRTLHRLNCHNLLEALKTVLPTLSWTQGFNNIHDAHNIVQWTCFKRGGLF